MRFFYSKSVDNGKKLHYNRKKRGVLHLKIIKRALYTLLTLICCMAFAGCGNTSSASGSGATDSSTSSETDNQASIVYLGSAGGEEYTIPQGLFEDTAYPDCYTYGEETEIPALKASCRDGEYEYTFQGWFWDLACTTPFESIPETQTGTVTLYAKLSIATWSGRL